MSYLKGRRIRMRDGEDEEDKTSSGYEAIRFAESMLSGKIERRGKQMETKSRFEVMSDLEERKHELMQEVNGLDLKESRMKKDIEMLTKQLEEFQSNKELLADGLKEQIESIDKSLKRFDSQKK